VTSKLTPCPNPKTSKLGDSKKKNEQCLSKISEMKVGKDEKVIVELLPVVKSTQVSVSMNKNFQLTVPISEKKPCSSELSHRKENLHSEGSREDDASSGKAHSYSGSDSPVIPPVSMTQMVNIRDYKSGTPRMRSIIQNHKLMVDFYKPSRNELPSFQIILETHLTHNLDFMDTDELKWNKGILRDLSIEFKLSLDCFDLINNVLQEMICLRKRCRPVFKSLVDTDNRRRDKEMIERVHGLTEQGLLDLMIYSKTQPNLLIATGYFRMLYGDHGPYIEFISKQINWEAFPHRDQRGKNAYFDYWYSNDRSVRLYQQLRTVRNKPNPPHLFGALRADHNRPEGYADYVKGRYYADASNITVKSDTYISLLRRIHRTQRC